MQRYDMEYLASVCPDKYALGHLPISGRALLSVDQKFSMDQNNQIMHDLFNEAIKTENLYARVETYMALMGAGMHGEKTDLVLASREMISKLIADLSAKGYTSQTLLYFDLMSDLTARLLFADLIKDEEIHEKYNNLIRYHADVPSFIDQLSTEELGIMFIFLQNTEYVDLDIFAQSVDLKWQKFVSNEDKTIGLLP